MRPDKKFRGFGKFFLIMFSILGHPFFFLSHVFLFRNWFQICIALGDAWVRGSGTSSCFFSYSLLIIWRVICADPRTLRTVSPLTLTWDVGFLSKSNPGKCHCCYTADHSWISVVLISWLYVVQAMDLCCNLRCIWLPTNCWSRSKKSLKRCLF